ncbi:ribosome biogenesis GTPase Der [Dichotomicrobium thermohalophilum]|uniref:GTPase Der n=1 Tax=Dichotomicrobium thermohalophilum TaxID=933063 RepID=A0A397Q6P4_9HYPH|nr:ribosome biogenesis GTPase Der [Dichotomicrobium thermohalophilum]RIA56623.1 GTP-binding protein [Dichotomicrobium thermohalophilum]
MTLKVAIVGRPNVGKSTLFNRLTGRKLALVAPMPGLTRDRREGAFEVAGQPATLIDTAGLEDAEAGSIAERMRVQSERAIAEADIVLFVIDARVGVTPVDEMFADIARQSGHPVILVANKAEGSAGESGVYEAYSLGLGDPVAISAEHGEGIGDLHDRLETEAEALLRAGIAEAEAAEAEERPIRVAIIGRPNAGKSTLFNRLAGEERAITGPEPGLTRDAIAIDLTWGDQAFKLYDTAGLRRRARVHEEAEKLSVSDALRAIRFAEVVIVLLEADRALEKQDLHIAALAADEGRAMVIAINKWDLVRDKDAKRQEFRAEIDRLLPQIKGVPMVAISALTGRGLNQLMAQVGKAYELWNARFGTGKLNRWLSEVVDAHPPPAPGGRRLKLRYITQPGARPPRFVVFCSRPEAVPASYERYLINSLRDAFDLWGVPVRLFLRKGKNPYQED